MPYPPYCLNNVKSVAPNSIFGGRHCKPAISNRPVIRLCSQIIIFIANIKNMGACASTPGSPTFAPFVSFREDDLKELFEIDALHPINKGGKGCIYKCVEKSTGQVYVLKSLSKKKLTEEDHDELQLSIRVMKHLAKENSAVLKLRDVFEDQKHVHLIADQCTGGDLFDRILSSKDGFNESKAAGE